MFLYICFYCIIHQINAALINIRDFFQKPIQMWTPMGIFKYTV